MADIELVIKIPEEIRVAIGQMGLLRIPNEMTRVVDKAIQHGTPLPKGCDIQRIIPKKVDVQKWIDTKCPNPNCNRELSTFYSDGYYTIEHKPDFCPNCGQALLWEESEVEE